MVTLTVRTLDAETDKPVFAFSHDGSMVNVSLIVIPVTNPPPSWSTGKAMLAAVEGDPNNGPLSAPASDKGVTSTPEFSQYAGYLAGTPRIYRIPDEGLSIDLGLVGGDVGGWMVGVIPASSNVYEFSPTALFVAADQDLTVWGFKLDLSPLAREVLEKRGRAKAELAKLAPEWGGSLTDVPWPVLQMVHNYIENAGENAPHDPRLAAYWINDFSWAVMDFAIPAREFDLLVDNYAQVRGVIEGVPWPHSSSKAMNGGWSEQGIPHFDSCALGLPVMIGTDGTPLTITNWRLCVPSFSQYFPRSDDQIRMDLATLWLTDGNFGLIIECIVKHVQEAADAMRKRARIMRIIGYVAPILLQPSFATIIAAITDAAGQTFLKNSKWYVTAIFDLAVGGATALLGGGEAIGGWEESIIKGTWDKSLAFVKQIITMGGLTGLKQVADDAAKLAELAKEPKSAGALSAAGEVLDSMTDAQVEALFKAVQDGASFADFIQLILETKNLPPVLLPWLGWCIGHSGMGIVLAGVFSLAKEIGALLNSAWGQLGAVDPQKDVTLPLVDQAAATVPMDAATVSLLNGENPKFPQQAVTTASAAAGVASVTGTVATLTALGILVTKGLIR